MEKLSDSKRIILDAMDEEIAKLEKKVEKVQPILNELNQLRKTRATLLNERTATGGVSGNRLSMETVIQAFRDSEYDTMSAVDLSKATGFPDSTVRSHLNRARDVRYKQHDDGEWSLIGEE